MSLPYFLQQSLLKMSTKSRTKTKLFPHDICHNGLSKILYIHELDKQVKILGQRTWRNPARRKPKMGKAKTLVETLALKIGVESSHVLVDKAMKRSQILSSMKIEQENNKHKCYKKRRQFIKQKKSEKRKQSMEIGDEDT